MDKSISAFIGTTSAFLSQIETTTRSLAESIQQRPIPLDSAASSFLQHLDAQVSAAANDLECLNSVAFGTVSFAELLGHCNEVYKLNQSYISQLEESLKCLGYVPEVDVDGKSGDFELDLDACSSKGSETMKLRLDSVEENAKTSIELDDIFESMSLQNLGLSDACLAALASEDRDKQERPELFLSRTYGNNRSRDPAEIIQEEQFPLVDLLSQKVVGVFPCHDLSQDTRDIINLSKEDYATIPSYMKGLASWEETFEAVGKINSKLRKRQDGMKEVYSFTAEDLEDFGLGRKGRSYLLLLLKMNKLVVEMDGGCVTYRVIPSI